MVTVKPIRAVRRTLIASNKLAITSIEDSRACAEMTQRRDANSSMSELACGYTGREGRPPAAPVVEASAVAAALVMALFFAAPSSQRGISSRIKSGPFAHPIASAGSPSEESLWKTKAACRQTPCRMLSGRECIE